MYVAYKAPKKQTRAQAVRLLAKQFVERHQNRINPTTIKKKTNDLLIEKHGRA